MGVYCFSFTVYSFTIQLAALVSPPAPPHDHRAPRAGLPPPLSPCPSLGTPARTPLARSVTLLERSQHGPSILSVRAFAASPQPLTHTHVPQRSISDRWVLAAYAITAVISPLASAVSACSVSACVEPSQRPFARLLTQVARHMACAGRSLSCPGWPLRWRCSRGARTRRARARGGPLPLPAASAWARCPMRGRWA